MEEETRKRPVWVNILITVAVVAAIVVIAFFAIRLVSSSRRQSATPSGEGMYGTWVSDFSKCVVTIDEDGTLQEVNGINTATVRCDMEQTDIGRYLITPADGDFLFADYYVYEEIDGNISLVSYIYLDTQQKVREEYISFYKSAE